MTTSKTGLLLGSPRPPHAGTTLSSLDCLHAVEIVVAESSDAVPVGISLALTRRRPRIYSGGLYSVHERAHGAHGIPGSR